jgi:hypothetical protein
MSESDQVNLGFEIGVVKGDLLTYAADVLVIKYAHDSFGTEARLVQSLQRTGRATAKNSSEFRLWQRESAVGSPLVLVVGLRGSILTLDYTRIRDLGRLMLEGLLKHDLAVHEIATIVHGVGLGLDETEAFRALLLGLSDAYHAGTYPTTLKRVTFVERDQLRYDTFREALNRFLPTREAPPAPPLIEEHELSKRGKRALEETADAVRAIIAGPESFEPEFRQPEADDTTPHVFVAMPFRDDYDDQFYLAIQPCVKGRGLLCERMDLDAFTGDITDRMFNRIRTAQIMIALLDGGNPNVYLEVGYAWGVDTQTVLLAHKEEPLPFDVRGHRVLIYDKIYLLKQMLDEELQRLLGN